MAIYMAYYIGYLKYRLMHWIQDSDLTVWKVWMHVLHLTIVWSHQSCGIWQVWSSFKTLIHSIGPIFLFQMRRELKTMMNEQQQAGTRALSDMDVRMNTIKQRMTTLEDQLDARVASVSYENIVFLLVTFTYTFVSSFWTETTTIHVSHNMTERVFGSFRPGQTRTSLRSYRS